MKWSILLVCAFLQFSVSIPIEDDSHRISKREVSELISTQSTQVTALGREADLGDLYVREIVRLLEAKAANETESVGYYIEDDPNMKVPKVNAYLEGNVVNSFPVGKTEYVVLISYTGQVILIDGNTYDQITTHDEPKLKLKSVAVVNDTFYSIDTITGSITSTNIKNIITPPQDDITWNLVGSFPNGSHTESVAAVNETNLYFTSSDGILYKYDTVLKTVMKCANLQTSYNYPSLTIVNGILYIYHFSTFFSFDGAVLTKLATPEVRYYPGLFEFKGNVCVVGGDKAYANNDQHPVYCYDPDGETWTVSSYINEARNWPGVVTTKSGTIIFGGYGVNSAGTSVYLKSVEIFNHDTKVWSYIPSPPAMTYDYYSATSIYF